MLTYDDINKEVGKIVKRNNKAIERTIKNSAESLLKLGDKCPDNESRHLLLRRLNDLECLLNVLEEL